MAIIMISELPGAGPEFADVARQQGLFAQMKSAPGFMGHWSGATDSGYRVFEVWESPEAHQAWLDGMVKPSLPPGAEPVAPAYGLTVPASHAWWASGDSHTSNTR